MWIPYCSNPAAIKKAEQTFLGGAQTVQNAPYMDPPCEGPSSGHAQSPFLSCAAESSWHQRRAKPDKSQDRAGNPSALPSRQSIRNKFISYTRDPHIGDRSNFAMHVYTEFTAGRDATLDYVGFPKPPRG